MPIRLFDGIRPLDRGRVLRDVLAGASTASINIPQVLGYARIAGAPVVTGLYTLILPLVAFAVFGSSRHLIVAADSATAAIFSSSLSQMTAPAGERYMALVGMVTLLTAALLLVARLFKLGFLADFLSRTVLVGFLAGVGLQVAIAMLSDMSGVAVNSRYSLVRVWEVVHGLRQPNLSTLALSAWRRSLPVQSSISPTRASRSSAPFRADFRCSACRARPRAIFSRCFPSRPRASW
jgi:SulP family sulfate permease